MTKVRIVKKECTKDYTKIVVTNNLGKQFRFNVYNSSNEILIHTSTSGMEGIILSGNLEDYEINSDVQTQIKIKQHL